MNRETTMTATKTALVALASDRILYVGPASLDLAAARKLAGSRVEMPTLMANETDWYTMERVSENDMTGDIVAWMVRPGKIGGHHATIVAKR
jgi:hypothetical protein